MKKFFYSYVRFVPIPAHAEFVNLGVIIGSDHSMTMTILAAGDKARAFAKGDEDLLENLMAVVRDLEYPSESQTFEDWLRELHRFHVNILQYSAPCPILAESIGEAMQIMSQEFSP